MARTTYQLGLSVFLALGVVLPGVSLADDKENLAPYKMLRSMQFVQDSVVLGDHSAGEMQRFMLGTIDKRLRAADPAIFEDPRNVDAALIYTMSGGNPATLEYLVARDVDGYFDNRVSDVLRKYLSGKGTLVSKTLGDMVPEYKDKKIGPYLALVAANTILPTNPEAALKFYDWARLSAPGTIVEEAALRRSVSITTSAGMVDRGLGYSRQYARRFLHSPYASQFADLFVVLAVDHYGAVTQDDIQTVLGFMDDDRQREVYLRIARKATIAGKNDLARMAATSAQTLSKSGADTPEALAHLYNGVANISTEGVGDAMQSINGIAEASLSPRDKALRAAAASIAQEVLRAPDPNSLTQDSAAKVADVGTDDPTRVVEDTAPHSVEQDDAAVTNAASDANFQSFVSTGRSKLDEIDKLLNKESDSP